MWWLRVGILVGSVVLGGALLEGCTRKREEATPPDRTPPNPFPTGSGSYTPPRPRIGPPSDPPPANSVSVTPPPVTPVAENCDQYIRPVMSVTINNPRSELETLQTRVIPLLNTHAEESRIGNF